MLAKDERLTTSKKKIHPAYHMCNNGQLDTRASPFPSFGNTKMRNEGDLKTEIAPFNEGNVLRQTHTERVQQATPERPTFLTARHRVAEMGREGTAIP